MSIHLVLGGARSGKTHFAEQAALSESSLCGLPVTYVATGLAIDDEMQARIERHKELRSPHFQLLESPRDLPAAVQCEKAATSGVLLIDCLATYLGTLLYDRGESVSLSELLAEGQRVLAALRDYPHAVFVVSNEVGSGIVPIYASARLYRDVLGLWNSEFAAAAGAVTLLVAGLPVPLKREPTRL